MSTTPTQANLATRTVTGQLVRNAVERAEHEAFRYRRFDPGSTGSEPRDIGCTWSQLYRRALGVAHDLTDGGQRGRPVLLVYDTGIDSQVAFLGALLAGAIAVPAPPPRKPYSRSLDRLAGIRRDCGAEVAFASATTVRGIAEHSGSGSKPAGSALAGLRWRTVEDTAPSDDDTGLAAPRATDPAYLQYTSGSTSAPKGVRISQAEVSASCAAMHDAWRHDTDSVLVSWLPMFHDMGLVYCGLAPVLLAMPTVLLSPVTFVTDPMRWLRAMHEFGASHSISPNFGFDVCARRVDPAAVAELDLSRWRVAVNASEPVRAASLRRFAETLAPARFDPAALVPAYGLAEATLMVTSARAGAGPVIRSMDPDALAVGRGAPLDGGIDLVSSGSALDGFDVRVVDPDTATPLPDGHCGEVWVAGPSVSTGYAGHPDATTAVFGVRLGDTRLDDDRRYLRTGDIGFLLDGELFVTSRRKDLIVVAGRNHHPQDLEATVADAHPALRAGCAAAFSVDSPAQDRAAERVVVVCETVDDELPADTASAADTAIRRAIAEHHDLTVDVVALIRRGTLAKTSSGKIQRSANRAAYLAGTLDTLGSRPESAPETGEAVDPTTLDSTMLRDWLRTEVARTAGLGADRIADDEPFATYGLGSVRVAELAAALSARTGSTVPETLLYDRPTVGAVVAALGSRSSPPVEQPHVAQPPVVQPPVVQPPVALAPRSSYPPGDSDDARDVAIVGIGCRVPGAAGPEELWNLLCSGTDAVREVPPTRWDRPGEPALRWAGLLDDPDALDSAFFGISPRETAAMDPQQRLLLAVGWEAIEDAGLDPSALAGSDTGVFVGVWSPEFALRAGSAGFAEPYLATGSAHSIVANRLSYLLDLHGPSLAVDTACSSSLVAVHLAVRSLLDDECAIAIAGGTNTVSSPEVTAGFATAHLLSPTGRCRSFGADADGYVRAEGAAVVVHKRLGDALADGDTVYAVIRGSAINHDGRTNGLTAPSGAAQQAVIRAAHRRAGTRPTDVDLVEAHGSGTPVGDLIEATALGAVVGTGRTGAPCVVGSVKSSVGHLEAAAGVAGVIRAALALHHGETPPTLHAERTNPRLDLPGLGLRVNSGAVVLRTDRPAVAGVSSFGFGGANAHVVLQQRVAPGRPSGLPVPDRAMLLAVSARSPRSLAALAARYRDLLDDQTTSVAAVCLAAGRRGQHPLRVGVLGADRAGLRAALDEVPNSVSTGSVSTAPTQARSLVFAFGDSTPAGAAQAFLQDRVFRRTVDACDALVRDLAGWSPVESLHTGAAELDPRLAAVVRLVVHLGLAELLRSWGLEPDAVTGSGVGDIAAGCVAGAVDRTAAFDQLLGVGRGGGDQADHARSPGAPRWLRPPWTPPTTEPTTVLDIGGVSNDRDLVAVSTVDRMGLLRVAGVAYERGHTLDWAAVTGTTARMRPPSYPWDHDTTPGAPTPTQTPTPTAVTQATVTLTPATPDQRDRVRRAAADLLGTTPERVVGDTPFSDLGMDSLTGVDLHERLEQELGTELPLTAVLNHPTVDRLAEFLVEHLATAPAPPPPPVPTATAAATTTTARTDDDVVDELIADLARLLPSLLDSDRPARGTT